MVVSPDSPRIFALQHSLAPPLTPAPPIKVVADIFANCLPPAKPPPPVTFDTEPPPPVTTDSMIMTPPLPADRDESLLLSLSVNPTSLCTSDEDDHIDPFLPQGLLFHCFMTDQPPSPSFVAHYHDISSINLALALPPDVYPPVLGSVTRICGQP